MRTVLSLAILALALSLATVADAQATAPSNVPSLPTLWIVGDSTVKNNQRGALGWGAPVEKYFDTARINVANRARGGRSSRTYQTEKLWDEVLAGAKPGDFVLIQFGHNDGGPIDDAKARGSLRGIGDESKEIANPATKQQEVVHTFGWYMRKYIADAKEKGMTPIILSPVPRVPKEPVQLPPVPREIYAEWAEAVAKEKGALFIDLNLLILNRYATLTPQQIKSDYLTEADNTHTSVAGAELNASCVVDGIKSLSGCRLKSYLKQP